jgi:protoheme IX farnesyltransferase
MKTAVTIYDEAPALSRTRLADYVELTKPRIAVMVLVTVAAGVILASDGPINWLLLVNTLFGTALVASGASALNQLLERETDAVMRRTENRPLPAGRLQAGEVLVFGVGLGIGGVLYLALALPTPLAALIAAVTFVSYVFVYTPLKRKTSLNTVVGAIPGALPPVIGWAAVRGSIDSSIVAVFLIIFLWQVPHFLDIAWIYREDYRRAGLQMLPVVDKDCGMSSRKMVSYCLALIPTSLAPLVLGGAGPIYLAGALLLGAGFLGAAIAFALDRSMERARRVLRASLIYLPLLLALLLLDVASR